MAVEIGRLVVQARFGEAPQQDAPDIETAIARLRRELLRAIDDRIAEAERRSRER